jgi:acyl-[acyl-carrier-protein]-phospholipid O-acyltransferase/long-chain-fatty-acid--[acyl-carrier-protein] ligase
VAVDEGRDLPPLGKDRAFIGLTVAQFLGAFNDNLFKQLVLLIAIDYKQLHNLESDPYQAIATFAFSIPFVLFSGVAGFISDKISKRTMIVACKAMEVVAQIGGMIAFLTGTIGTGTLIIWLIFVLFLSGLQSALFGPSKYGILPEIFRERDLPLANGIIQMTTFLAIIFGTALSGYLKDAFPGHLWVVSAVCIFVAIAGTLASLPLRRSPPAHPRMAFTPECLVVERSALRLIFGDKPLLATILVYSLFWFAGAVALQLTNYVALDQLDYSNGATSACVACIGLGIAIGCIVCGRWSRGRVRFDLVRKAAVGLALTTIAISLICVLPGAGSSLRLGMLRVALVVLGFFAGMFAVPPQVFIQTRPPATYKGRVIGANNLINWIFITLAAAWYYLLSFISGAAGFAPSWLYLTIGALFVVTVILFRQPNPAGSASK